MEILCKICVEIVKKLRREYLLAIIFKCVRSFSCQSKAMADFQPDEGV